MNRNHRAVLWGGLAFILLVVIALQFVPAVFVVLALAVVALALLVLVSRMRLKDRGDPFDMDDWREGDEWGLGTDEPDDDLVDLSGRLGDVGLTETTSYVEPLEERHRAPDEDLERELEYEEVPDEAGLYEETAAAVDEVYEEADYTESVYDEQAAGELVREAILSDRGDIVEERVDSDETILAAAHVSSIEYEEVLTREDANAETREILNRVASLLEKYE